jgi:hypothetical protein
MKLSCSDAHFVVFLKHCSLDDANDPSTQHLQMLEGSFVWEARSLYFVAVGVPVISLYRPAGLVIGGLGLLVVIVMVRPRINLCFTRHQIKS